MTDQSSYSVDNAGPHGNLPTIGHMALSALGYLLVAFFCLSAGFILRNKFPSSLQLYETISFLVLIAPYYICRNFLYERREVLALVETHIELRRWIKTIARQVPLLLVLISSLHIIISVSPVTRPTVQPEEFWQMVVRLYGGILPFYILLFWAIRIWPGPNIFWFRYRSFFPALLTCALPFMFGWSLSETSWVNIFAATFVPSALVLVWWLISLGDKKQPKRLIIMGVLLLLAMMASFPIFNIFPTFQIYALLLQTFSFGFFMTMVMGVSESWRLTTRLRENIDYVPPTVYDNVETAKNLHLAGTNIATCLFLPCFLLTIMHPSTNIFYPFATFLFLVGQYLMWFTLKSKWNYKIWNIVGLVFGFLFPLIIAGGISASGPTPFRIKNIFQDIKVQLAIVALFFGSIGVLFKKHRPKKDFLPFRLKSYENSEQCFALSYVVLILLLAFSFFISTGREMLNQETTQDLDKKITILQYLYLACIAALAVRLFIFGRKINAS